MERQIIEVKESKKSSNRPKKKVDLKKVAKVIVENKETIATVATTIGTLINSTKKTNKNTSRKSTTKKSKTSTKKTTSSKKKAVKSKDTVSTLMDMFLK